MLMGEYHHSLDDKGRMNFPSKLRDELGLRFYVTRWLDDCLVVFSETEWTHICNRIRELPLSTSRDIQRFLFANAFEAEPDKQGRILIPQNLREKAGIDKDVVIVGLMNKAEIWDETRWQNRNDEIDASDIDRQMEELGI